MRRLSTGKWSDSTGSSVLMLFVRKVLRKGMAAEGRLDFFLDSSVFLYTHCSFCIEARAHSV